jgi:chemotaxis protein MotB
LLEEQGIDPARLSAEARGEYAPIAKNTSNRGRARNRRIEIYVVPELDPRTR